MSKRDCRTGDQARRATPLGPRDARPKTQTQITEKTPMKKSFTTYSVSANGTRSVEEASSELVREMDVRRRLYDKWVAEGRMSWVDAHDRLERHLTAIMVLAAYENVVGPDAPKFGVPPWDDSVTPQERGASEPSHEEGNHKVSPF